MRGRRARGRRRASADAVPCRSRPATVRARRRVPVRKSPSPRLFRGVGEKSVVGRQRRILIEERRGHQGRHLARRDVEPEEIPPRLSGDGPHHHPPAVPRDRSGPDSLAIRPDLLGRARAVGSPPEDHAPVVAVIDEGAVARPGGIELAAFLEGQSARGAPDEVLDPEIRRSLADGVRRIDQPGAVMGKSETLEELALTDH